MEIRIYKHLAIKRREVRQRILGKSQTRNQPIGRARTQFDASSLILRMVIEYFLGCLVILIVQSKLMADAYR